MNKTVTKKIAYQVWKSHVRPKASHISNTIFNASKYPLCIKMTNTNMGNRTESQHRLWKSTCMDLY